MRAAARAAATVPLTALVLAGVAGVAAPALAADRDSGGELSVTTDGVSFDASRLADEQGWLSYAVSAPDGSRTRLLGDGYTAEDAADGHLELDVPGRAYRDGWCVTWVHVTGIRDQFASWAGDSPVCTTEPAATPSPTAAPTAQPSAAPAPPPVAEAAPSAPEPPPAAPVEPVTAEPEPEPAPTETPTETPTASPTPTPSSSAGTATTDRPEPARTPLVTAGERSAPPAPGSAFPTLVVAGVGGLVAAAAGGAILLLRRAG